jgi:hypothetical protein
MADSSRAGNWHRVSRAYRCPICRKPDWCLYAGPEGDPTAAICARVESSRRCGEAGWLHRLRDDWRLTRQVVRSISIFPRAGRPDLYRVFVACQSAVRPEQLDRLARALGLSTGSLRQLGIGWCAAYRAWSFPMRDAAGKLLGIRLRREDGGKFAVKGSREGLFLPEGNSEQSETLFVCEGPTDTAALLDLGFGNVAGRPSCTGGVRLLAELVQHRKPAAVVIVADNDGPGHLGADKLASVLACYAPTVRVIAPPAGIKDARAWLRAGAQRQDVEHLPVAAPARRLTVRAILNDKQGR